MYLIHDKFVLKIKKKLLNIYLFVHEFKKEKT